MPRASVADMAVPRHLFIIACALPIAACTEHTSTDPRCDASHECVSGEGGEGGTSGAGGSSGSSGNGGTDASGSGGVGGSGGNGGVGGSGGSGGSGVVPCSEAFEGYFAIKTVIDVWWELAGTTDPGRGKVELFLLGELDSIRDDGRGNSALKVCGLRLPPSTSDVWCYATQLELPDALWESPSLPRVMTTAHTSAFESGGVFAIEPAVSLLGLALPVESANDPTVFPAPDATVTCAAGEGEDCFPDHDDDGEPGVTIRVRNDGAIYTYTNAAEGGVARNPEDMNYGRASLNGREYDYAGLGLYGPDYGAGAGGPGVTAVDLRGGFRFGFGSSTEINTDCASSAGNGINAMLNTRIVSCKVDPATYPTNFSYPNDECPADRVATVDGNIPRYQILRANEQPPMLTRLPNGWAFVGRDIDRTPSLGPRSAIVRLNNASIDEPNCAQVRNATFPAL